MDLQQSTLLKVRQRDTPATCEVAIQTVAEHGSESALGIPYGAPEPHRRIPCIQIDRQCKRLEDPLRQLIVGNPGRSRFLHGFVKRRSQQTNLNEVIEMSGLKCCVLAVIGETRGVYVHDHG